MPSEQFERTLRERFAQAEIPPPAGLWDRIEAGVAPPVERKRRFLWIWWSMAALLFCTVGLAWVFQPQAPNSAVSEVVQTAPAIPAPQNQESSESSAKINQFPHQEKPSSQSSAPGVTHNRSSDQSRYNGNSTWPSENQNVSQRENDSISQAHETVKTASIERSESLLTLGDTTLITTELIPRNKETVVRNDLAIFHIHRVLPFQSSTSILALNTSTMPVTQIKRFGKWAVDISASSGYATSLFSPIPIDKSYETDYAGYANRSAFATNTSGQVATVRFPRWHHTLSVETSRSIHPRWRISLGMELQAGLEGLATLGEIESSFGSPISPTDVAEPIILEQSSINLGAPSDFTHVSLGIPARLSYLSTMGRGSLEHSIGYSLNRSWILAEPQTQLESIAFGLNTDQIALFSGVNLPPPVLYAKRWHSDVRLRSRYFLQSRSAFQPFIGMELQSQISPAFGGDAGVNERSFLIGMELGVRIR